MYNHNLVFESKLNFQKFLRIDIETCQTYFVNVERLCL